MLPRARCDSPRLFSPSLPLRLPLPRALRLLLPLPLPSLSLSLALFLTLSLSLSLFPPAPSLPRRPVGRRPEALRSGLWQVWAVVAPAANEQLNLGELTSVLRQLSAAPADHQVN